MGLLLSCWNKVVHFFLSIQVYLSDINVSNTKKVQGFRGSGFRVQGSKFKVCVKSEGKNDGFVKSQNINLLSLRRTPDQGPGQASESSHFNSFCTPAIAGVTGIGTFYDFFKNAK
jgi:hypothetical protein